MTPKTCDGVQYAMKEVALSDDDRACAFREVRILKYVYHRNTAKMIACFEGIAADDDKSLYIVLELAQGSYPP